MGFIKLINILIACSLVFFSGFKKCHTSARDFTSNHRQEDTISRLIHNSSLKPNNVELEELTNEAVFLLLSENPKQFIASLKHSSPEVVNKVLFFLESPLTDDASKEELGRIITILKEEDTDSLWTNRLIQALQIAKEKY